MRCKQSALQITKFYISVALYYMVTLIFGIYIFRPQLIDVVLKNDPVAPVVLADIAASNPTEAVESAPIIMGKPVRLLVPSVGIDLPVIDGQYNPLDQSWTLVSDKAHFAIPSLPANDRGGNTLIYGHNTPPVFKKLSGLTLGASADVYTDNGYVFSYTFIQVDEVAPDNTTTFSYSGTPILTLQTCSGVWSETREMFTFKFEKVTPR